MAALPICSLCRGPERIRKAIEPNKKNFLVFSIFMVLLIEWFSIIYLNTYEQKQQIVYDKYLFFWYPLLTQLALFIILFSIFLWKERLHFCARKSATTFYLSLYYALGFFAVLFCLQAKLYYQIITISNLFVASYVFLVSIFKNNTNG